MCFHPQRTHRQSKSYLAQKSCLIGAVLAASASTLPAIAANSRNAFIACSASAYVVAPTETSVSSALLQSESGRFALRPQATSSMGEWNRIQARGMLLKFFGYTGLLVAALGRAVRAQQPKSRCCHDGVRCFATASVQLSMPAVTAGAEASRFSHGSIVGPSVLPVMASTLETMAPVIGHTAPQLVAVGMVASSVAKRWRCPRAARKTSRRRRKANHAAMLFAAATTKGTSRTTRRHIGARLFAHSPAHAGAAAAKGYDPSQVRTQIQFGLMVWNRSCTASSRESKTPSASKGSTTGTRTGMNVQLCRHLL